MEKKVAKLNTFENDIGGVVLLGRQHGGESIGRECNSPERCERKSEKKGNHTLGMPTLWP